MHVVSPCICNRQYLYSNVMHPPPTKLNSPRGPRPADVEVHVQLDTPQSVRLLWKRDRPVVETSNWQHTTLTTDTYMFLAGFELAIPASYRPKTLALDRSTTGVGSCLYLMAEPFCFCETWITSVFTKPCPCVLPWAYFLSFHLVRFCSIMCFSIICLSSRRCAKFLFEPECCTCVFFSCVSYVWSV
jgi:hypothetical protein